MDMCNGGGLSEVPATAVAMRETLGRDFVAKNSITLRELKLPESENREAGGGAAVLVVLHARRPHSAISMWESGRP